MFTFQRMLGFSLFVFVLASSGLAQELRGPLETPREPLSAAPAVTATASAKRVRFVSPGTVVQLRLEVFNEAGQKLFDTQLHGGNVLDWHLQDGAGQRLTAGSYACVLTIKSLSGRLSQRVGLVTVNDEKAAVETAEAAQLSTAQQQTIGPVEGNAAFTIVQPSDEEAITAVTHDGTKGQLSRTRGALSFRVGDVFSGKDKEQMRLTADGNLGIGTSDPQAKLDVAGTIRAERVVIAKPGRSGSDPAGDAAHAPKGNDTEDPLASGSGTQNFIAKWTDNAGTLGNALITETNGNVVVGNAGQTGNVQIFGTAVQDVFAGMGPDLSAGPAFNFGYAGLSFGRGAGFFNVRPDAGATPPNPSLRFMTANVERMIVTNTGNVGIGNSAPGSKLDVTGNINTSTQYNIGGNRVLSIPGSSNTFAGIAAGNSNPTGSQNSFFGHSAGLSTSSGSSNSFFGVNAGRGNTSGGGNSSFGVDAGFVATTANFNAFFGNQAGRNTTTGSKNSFFGQNAGFANTTASNNSFFGQAAGFANTTGSDNSFFGINAGQANTSGGRNAFFGTSAGFANTAGSSNSFFGPDAGRNNTSGVANSFFGNSAGLQATSGDNNSFFGSNAGLSTQNGHGNSFFGAEAGRSNETGVWNSFFGGFAGHNNTGSANSFFGQSAGHDNSTGGSNAFFGNEAGSHNTTASFNSFFGRFAGTFNTTGEFNAFFGSWAGSANTTGSRNSFFGYNAGGTNTGPTASANSFFGYLAGEANSSGNSNSFFGQQAGAANTSGFGNSFFGSGAGVNNTTGSSNVAIGNGAGFLLATGNNNIYLAAGGPTDESNHIRIGGENIHTVTFIAGIKGSTVTGDAVLIDSNGQLGVLSSSRRFKQDIVAIGRASSKLMQLRPVVFHYRPEYVTGKPTLQYGLIAEEVARVFPELVGFDADGKPQTVRYHLLNTMLLNEMQKQEGHIQSQAQQLKSQAQQIEDLEARLRRLEAQAVKRRRR